MELQLSYIPRRLVRHAACSVSTEHTEQQSNRATEHSAGHVTHRSAVLAAGRNERRRMQTPLPGASLQAAAREASQAISLHGSKQQPYEALQSAILRGLAAACQELPEPA
jgi:hypothetical protein